MRQDEGEKRNSVAWRWLYETIRRGDFVSGRTRDLIFSRDSIEYQPETFRDDLTALIEKKQYQKAIQLLDRVDVQTQLDHDKRGYLLVAEDLIYRPSVPGEFSFPEDGDWEIPGTSDTNPNKAWQDAATSFASQYNAARWSIDNP
jgi:hypothetical protein